MAHPSPRSRGFKLLAGFAVAAAMLAALIGGAEGVLRLAGVGHPGAFAVKDTTRSGEPVWRENRWFTLAYFPEALVRRPVPFVLPRPKAPGTYRLFILGSSAAMGDPEPSFSVARLTEELLRRRIPEVRFEVVNAAITAVNSHVVREIAEDCAGLEPDAFFVYEGNNEVIGPYGPGTTLTPVLQHPSAIRWLTALNRLRLVQLAKRVGARRPSEDAWRGLAMFEQRTLPQTDPRLADVARSFDVNLRAIASSGHEAGATVWFSTVLVNARDFAPFRSVTPEFTTTGERDTWSTAQSEAQAALADDPARAAQLLRQSLALAPNHAQTAFLLGRALRSQGSIQEGDTWSLRAVDLDTLRFRTDARLNDTVRAASSGAGATLLDAAADALTSTEGPGDGLLYEHVHLNMAGTYLVARRLAAAVEQDLVRRGRASGPASRPDWVELAVLRRALAFSPYEQLLILEELINRHGKPPFLGRWGNEERLANLKLRAQAIRSALAAPGAREPVLGLYRRALVDRPGDAVLWRNLGMAAGYLGDDATALEALRRGLVLLPDDTDALAALLVVEQRLGLAGAAETRARLQALEPRHPGLMMPSQ